MASDERAGLESGFRLDDWEVRPRHCTLLDRGHSDAAPIHVEPRVMAVLTCLARHAGEVVTREEFLAEVWDGRVVSDEALSRCISLLRHHFADDSREPRFIRTVARIGYLLVPRPQPLAATAAGAATGEARTDAAGELRPAPTLEPVAGPPPQPAAASRRRTRLPAIATGSLVVLATLMIGYALSRSAGSRDGPTPGVTRLAVLPFDARDADAFGRDVGAELANEIVDSLAHVERVRIYGRTSAMAAAESQTDAVAAGRKLGVDAVLHGSVAGKNPGQALRIAVQLTATNDARVLWSTVYERPAEDIFAVQSSIASAVVRELVGLFNRDALAGIPSVEPRSRDIEAYQLYLRGAHQVRLRGEDSLRLAIELFSKAARRDPGYARAYLGLANAYALLPAYSIEDPVEMYALADAALASAERLSGSHTLSAGIRAYLGFVRWRWIEAETAFRTAIAAEPNNPDLRQQYSQLLGTVGRLDASLEEARLAQELDPLAPVIADRVGVLLLWLGRDVDAAREFALARELGLEQAAYPETKIILKLHERDDAAAATMLHALQHSVGRTDTWVDAVLGAYRHPAERLAAVALLDEQLRAGGISIRYYYGAMVLLESTERALRSFAQLADRDANDLELLFSRDATAIRRSAGFGDFVHGLGIDGYWDRFGWPPMCRRESGRIRCR